MFRTGGGGGSPAFDEQQNVRRSITGQLAIQRKFEFLSCLSPIGQALATPWLASDRSRLFLVVSARKHGKVQRQQPQEGAGRGHELGVLDDCQ